MKTISSLILGLVAATNISAQTPDPVIMTIDGKPISKSEFLGVYNKNPGVQGAEKKSVQEYVDLFTNFKLKVREAEEMKLDTLPSFKQEFAGYRKTLGAPYLTDKNVNDQLITQAYERMKTEYRSSHVLVACTEDALPKDTIIAYNKAMEYRKRILKGEDFGKIAIEAANYSGKGGDKSANENKGDLGYQTSLDLVYPFENACYAAKVGDVTMPVRTSYGYHIIKLVDKRPYKGEVKIAHIMLRFRKEMSKDDSANVKKKADELYDKLKSGSKFEELAMTYSEDKNNNSKGGELNWYKYDKMPTPEFETPVANLNAGEFTQPIRTRFGWHIVKCLEKRGLQSFDELKGDIKQKVNRSRGNVGRISKLNEIKKNYGFAESKVGRPKPVFTGLEEMKTAIDTTYLEAKWTADKVAKLNKALFVLDGKTYTQTDFAKYLESRQTRRPKGDIPSMIEVQYKNFVDETCINVEETKLESKYPEYKNLLQEYRDGILLFELTDRKVWTKAIKDTVGLQGYYEVNKNNYLWGERADVTTYKCADEKIAKALKKMLDKKKSQKEILDKLNKKSQLNVTAETVTYLKGEDANIDANWKEGVSDIKKMGDKYVIYNVNKLTPKSPKALNECRGLVTADYQTYLEKEWLENLKKTHKVVVNQEVVNTIK